MEQPKLEDLLPKQPTVDELQMTIFSLQKQHAELIGKFTNLDVDSMKIQQENTELKKELEEYRKKK